MQVHRNLTDRGRLESATPTSRTANRFAAEDPDGIGRPGRAHARQGLGACRRVGISSGALSTAPGPIGALSTDLDGGRTTGPLIRESLDMDEIERRLRQCGGAPAPPRQPRHHREHGPSAAHRHTGRRAPRCVRSAGRPDRASAAAARRGTLGRTGCGDHPLGGGAADVLAASPTAGDHHRHAERDEDEPSTDPSRAPPDPARARDLARTPRRHQRMPDRRRPRGQPTRSGGHRRGAPAPDPPRWKRCGASSARFRTGPGTRAGRGCCTSHGTSRGPNRNEKPTASSSRPASPAG